MKLDSTFRSQIEPLQGKPLLYFDEEKIILTLKTLLLEAVQKRARNHIAISFSGGVDSTGLAYLCSLLKIPFTLYSVGLPGAPDLVWAERIATHYKWPLQLKVISFEEAETIIKDVTRLLQTDDVTTVGVGCAGYAVLTLSHKNFNTLMTGLGSEEIFAGYDKHYKAWKEERILEETFAGLLCLFEKDLIRDTTLLSHFKVEGLCPYLDKDLISYALQIDPNLKINDEHKKLILRKTFLAMGLEKEFCFRKKQAAQYGTRFEKVIEKLAKRNGFTYKKEYLRSLL